MPSSSLKQPKDRSVPSIGQILDREVAAGRIPPQNLEAEASLIGSILIEKDAIIKIADMVTPEDFYDDRNGIVFSAILDLYEQRQPLDIVSLTNKLKEAQQLDRVGGASYVTELTSAVPTAAHVVHYAGIVSHKATLRRLIAAASNISQFGYDEQAPLEQLLDKAEQTIFEVSQKNLKQNFIPINSILSESFERLNELHANSGKLRGIPTGFRDLDKLLAGLQNSDLIILAARPSMGKTTLVMNIAHHVAAKEGVPVGFFSLEVSKEQLIDQLLAIESGVDSWKLRTGALEDDDFPRLNEAMAELSEAPLYIDDSAVTNVMEMRTKARRLQAEQGLGLIIIDYLQLISGGARSTEGRQQEVSEISRGLKGLARELDVPVIALSQLSRAVESRTPPIPQLADLRDSGCLTGDTLVYRSDTGMYTPISELAQLKNAQVQSLNDSDWKLQSGYVSNAFSTGFKQVYRLTTALGRTIRATANHKFLTIDGWKRLDQLSASDHIAVPRSLSGPSTTSMSEAELGLLGHLIGDGCTLPTHAIQYTTREPELAEIVANLAAEIFPGLIQPRIQPERSWYQVYLPSAARLTRSKHNPVSSWLQGLGVFGLRSHQKKVPAEVFRQPESSIAVFLRHIWATDGCINAGGDSTRHPSIYYATSSNRLAADIQSLLLRLSINARVTRVPQTNKGRDQYHVIVSGRPDILLFAAKVGALGEKRELELQRSTERLATYANTNHDIIPASIWLTKIKPVMNNLGITARGLAAQMEIAYNGSALYKSNLSRDRIGRLANITEDNKIASLAKSDVYWDRIRSILPDGEEEVYDLTVPGHHNFVADNIIVHNSIEQDSDVVMFIYRESYYDKQTERENVTDLMIKKHRNGPTGEIELYFHPEQRRFSNLDRFHG